MTKYSNFVRREVWNDVFTVFQDLCMILNFATDGDDLP